MWSLAPLGLLFIVLNWVLFRFYNISADLPVSYALFFFGLVNLNVLVFLGIVFFLGRNLVKIYADSKPRMIGKTLKTRLFLAFISFAFIPTTLMFLVSVFYINNSFDRWFANRTDQTLKDASALAEQYVSEVRAGSFYIGKSISKTLNSPSIQIPAVLERSIQTYGMDAIELYRLGDFQKFENIFQDKMGFYLPPINWNDVKKYVKAGKTRTVSRKTEQGEWLSSIVVIPDQKSILVVSKILPFTLLNTIESIATSRAEFQTSKDFKFPLKTMYLFILVTMTLVILAFGGWFSLYLAQSLSRSLFALGHATKRISKGDFHKIEFKTGMDEINKLVDNFNSMTDQLKTTRSNLNSSIDDLNRSSIYMNTLLAQISSAVVSCNNEYEITLINKRTQNLFSLDPDLVRGKSLKNVLPAEIFTIVESYSGGEDEVQAYEIDIARERDSVLPLQVSVSSLFGLNGNQIGYIITLEKVELLRENQRVKAWKEVATRVAHEIKNPLTPIKLSAERIQKKFGAQIEDPAFKQCTSTIVSQVDLIKDLVNEFNQFARFPKLKPTEVHLSDFLSDLVSIYKASHPELIFDVVFSPGLYAVIDTDQMKRVFINLIENSIEAMKSVDVKIVHIESKLSQSGNVAMIEVSDSGPGVPKNKWSDVFKTKYTTKKGSDGLGLSIVKKIVEDHGGRISIVQGEGLNSVFLVELSIQLKS